MRYTILERIFLVKKYYETKSIARVQGAWRSHFKLTPAPNHITIKNTISKFEKTGSVESLPPTPSKPSQKREGAEKQLKVLYAENPSLSSRKAACAVQMSQTTVLSILRDEFHWKPYKYQD